MSTASGEWDWDGSGGWFISKEKHSHKSTKCIFETGKAHQVCECVCVFLYGEKRVLFIPSHIYARDMPGGGGVGVRLLLRVECGGS